MSDAAKDVLKELVAFGETAADHLKDDTKFTNMDWYRLEKMLHALAAKAGRLNNAE